jgi:hypothetical protein
MVTVPYYPSIMTVLYAVDSNARRANKEMDENLRKFLEGRQIPDDIVDVKRESNLPAR